MVRPCRIAAYLLLLGFALAVTPGSANAGVVELTYMSFTYDEHPIEGQLIRQFEAEHPSIRIRVITKPVDQFENQLLLAYRGGVSPDVFEARPSYVTSLGLLGVMMDLMPFVKSEGSGYQELFLPSAWAMGTWKDKQYGIPWRFGAFATFVNPDLFRSAGIAVPPRWTFNEFLQIARKLTDRQRGVYGYGFAGARSDLGTSQIWSAWLFANGGTLLDGLVPKFQSIPGVEALQLWVDMVYRDLISPPSPATMTYKDVTDLFGQGKLAMWINGPWYIATVKRAYPDAPMAFAPMPMGRSEGSATTGTLMAISSRTKYPEQAWEFVKYMTGVKAQAAWAEAAQYVPALRELQSASFIQQGPLKVFSDAAVLRNSQQVGNLPEAGKLLDSLNIAIQKALLRQASPEDALREASNEWSSILERYK